MLNVQPVCATSCIWWRLSKEPVCTSVMVDAIEEALYAPSVSGWMVVVDAFKDGWKGVAVAELKPALNNLNI